MTAGQRILARNLRAATVRRPRFMVTVPVLVALSLVAVALAVAVGIGWPVWSWWKLRPANPAAANQILALCALGWAFTALLVVRERGRR